MSRFLIFSDLHLHNYTRFSRENGISQRLEDMLQLFKLIDNYIDGYIFAGDFFHYNELTPITLNYGMKILEIINKKKALFISGNHDIKTFSSTNKQSILDICKVYDNITYVSNSSIIEWNGKKVYLEPYGSITYPEEQVDYFIGHNEISGSTNSVGYKFQSGYSINRLSKCLKENGKAFIGHIHKFQILGENKNVIVPGTLFQNSLSDDENSKLVFLDFETGNVVVKDRQDLLKTEALIKNSTIDIASNKKSLEDNQQLQEELIKKLSIDSIIQDLIDNNVKDEAKREITKTKIKDIFDRCKSKNKLRMISSIRLKACSIHNFKSIKDFSFNFEELFNDNTIIVGKNYQGKTNLLEAIFWCITNETTENIPVNELINFDNEDNLLSVELELYINDDLYKIVRQRDKKSPFVFIYQFKDGKWEGYQQRMKDIQEDIYSILGISIDDIKKCVYIASNYEFIFSQGQKAKNQLISKIFNEELIAELQELSKEEVSKINNKLIQQQNKICYLDNKINEAEAFFQANKDLAIDNSQQEKIEERIKQLNDYISTSEQELHNTKLILNSKESDKARISLELNNHLNTLVQNLKIDEDKEKKHNLEKEIYEINQSEIKIKGLISNKELEKSNLEKEILKLGNEIKAMESHICPTCKQIWNNNENQSLEMKKTEENKKIELKQIIAELSNLNQQLSAIPLKDDLQKEIEEINSVIVSKEKQIDKLQVDINNEINNKSLRINKEIEDLNKNLQEIENNLSDYKNEITNKQSVLNSILRDKEILNKSNFFKERYKTDLEERNKEKELLDNLNLDFTIVNFFSKKLFASNGLLVKEINNRVIVYLQEEFNKIESFIGIKLIINQNLQVKASFNNERETYYPSCSRAQQKLIDLISLLCINKIISQRSCLKENVMGIIAIDEFLNYLDKDNIPLAMKILQNIFIGKLIFISHIPEYQEYFSNKILVCKDKENGTTYTKIS